MNTQGHEWEGAGTRRVGDRRSGEGEDFGTAEAGRTQRGGFYQTKPLGMKAGRDTTRLFAVIGGTGRRAGKFQIPSPKLQRNSNAQIPMAWRGTPPALPPCFGPWPKGWFGPAGQCRATPPFEIWSLDLLWNLELGIWSFSHTLSTENSGEPTTNGHPGTRMGGGWERAGSETGAPGDSALECRATLGRTRCAGGVPIAPW